MIVKVYQIKDSKFETCNYVFRDYKKAKECGFTMEDYEEVYSYIMFRKVGIENNYSVVMSEEEKKAYLESLFDKLNRDHPDDFKGHSLSVSDVVALGDELYYCDDCGWEKI